MPLERIQILVSKEQRRRLSELSERRNEPVTALVREAIDVAFPTLVDASERAAAARLLLERPAPCLPSPVQLDAMLASRFDVER